MTRPESLTHHLSNLLVGGTGLVYAWMLYLVTPEDEFSLVNHPLQPDVQAWHILTAPLLVFAVALSWKRHVWARIANGFPHRRKTGLVLFALFFPMVFSGYLIQLAVEESWRTTWIWTHVGTSILWIVAYLVHQLSHRPKPTANSGDAA